jgi:hypothetical protein
VIDRLARVGPALAAAVALATVCWVPGEPSVAAYRLTSAVVVPSAPPPVPSPIPISPAGSLGNFNLSSSSYAIARRFVLDEDTTIDRWYFAINGEGADCVDGRDGYGAGDGGTHLGRIVEVDQDTGLPAATLAAEEVNACDAYERAQDEFELNDRHQAHYVEFAPVSLEAGRMYAFVLANTDPEPGDGGGDATGNHMSPNLNFADLDDMGPHARNTLDPSAPGAAYGVDPRETTMWSEDQGTTWQFGDEVGWYGKDDGDGGMWPSGYRVAGGADVPHGWTYMNWPEEGPASVSYTAPVDGLLLEAGGASTEGDVGVVTVKNVDTGMSASTADLGTGLVNSGLDRPVPVARGQTYVVSTEGDVDTGSADEWEKIFDLSTPGSGRVVSTCPDCRADADRPMLYAAAAPGGGPAPGAPAQQEPDDVLATTVLAAAIAAAAVGLVLLVRLIRSRRKPTR